MKYFEYGKENKELVVILHGGVSYRGAEPTAKIVAEKYHVILADYDGFNPSEPDTEFVSVQNEARRLGDYIAENYGGHIDILYGLSYGGRVLMEVLADKRLSVTTTIADGISLKDYPNIKSKAGKDIYCFFFTGFFYVMMADPGPLRTKFLCKITGRTAEEAERLLYRHATWKSWKNQDYCLIGKKRFTWGIRSGKELEGISPEYTWVRDVSLVEGMKVIMPVYHLFGWIPAVKNISNKLVVFRKGGKA